MKADFEKGTKICPECKRELPIEMFARNKSTKDGLQNYCKVCKKQIQRIYYEKTQDEKYKKRNEFYKKLIY